MKIDSFFSGAARLMGAAIVAVCSIGFAMPVQAADGVVSKSNSTCDTFSGFSYNAAANVLSITCGAGQVQCNTTQGTFSIAGAGGTHPQVAPNSSTPITIQRTGGCQGKYYVLYGTIPAGLTGWTLTGGVTSTVQYVVFEDGDTSKTLTLNTGSTQGSFSIFLTKSLLFTDTSVKATLDGTLFVVDVVTQGNGGNPSGCSTSATFNQVYPNTSSGFQYNFNLAPGETTAYSFTLPGTANSYGNSIGWSTYETAAGPGLGAPHEIAFSTCPGDFNYTNAAGVQCKYFSPSYTGSSARIATVDGVPGACMMPAGPVYMNVRYTTLDGVNTCNNATGKCQTGMNLVFPFQ